MAISNFIYVLTADGQDAMGSQGETLDGGNVIPGFRLPVAEIFA